MIDSIKAFISINGKAADNFFPISPSDAQQALMSHQPKTSVTLCVCVNGT